MESFLSTSWSFDILFPFVLQPLRPVSSLFYNESVTILEEKENRIGMGFSFGLSGSACSFAPH